MFESDEAFRRQFDRDDPSFHGGDSRDVPLGGQRVPDGWDEFAGPRVEAKSSPESESVRQLRESLSALKTAVSQAQAAVGEGVVNNNSNKRPNVELAWEKVESQLKAYKTLVGSLPTELVARHALDSYEPEAAVEDLRAAIQRGVTKETYGDFVLDGQARTRRIFAEMTRLLRVMKEIKSEL